VEVVSVGTGSSYLFVCGQWLSLEKGCSVVEKDYESGQIRVGAMIERSDKPDGNHPITIKTASIRISVGNLPEQVFGSQICCVVYVLADHEDVDESWIEIARTVPLSGKNELFWPAFPALQYDPSSEMLPYGIDTLFNFVILHNNESFGNVKVTLKELLSHASTRTGFCMVGYNNDTCDGVAVLDSQILRNLQPNLYFLGTRSSVIEPQTVTTLNLRMMVANLPPRLTGAVLYASLFVLGDSHIFDRELCKSTDCDGDFEPFWDAIPLQIEPPNKRFPLGLDTQLRVTIFEKSAEFGDQIFGTVIFRLREALKLASTRRSILLEPDGVLDQNVTKLLEPKMFFHGTHRTFSVFDPVVHSVIVEPFRQVLVPHPPSEPFDSTATVIRKVNRARIIREFEMRQVYKVTAKSEEEEAAKIARALIIIGRLFAKFMHQARKKGGPDVTFLSFFKSKKSRAVVSIQRHWRAHVARATCSMHLEARRNEKFLQNSACVRIQCVYRKHLALLVIQRLTSFQRSFRISMLVVKVQARFRGILGRYRAQQARHEQHHRLKLQMFVRRWLLNKKIQQRRRNNAASIIQRNVLTLLGTSDALRYAFMQRRYAWQGMFIILWVTIIALLSLLTMKSGPPLSTLNILSSSFLAPQTSSAVPLRTYIMFDSFVSNILPILLNSRRNSSMMLQGSPHWELRVGGNYNGIFLPAATMFVPVGEVGMRLRRRSHASSVHVSDELLSVVQNVSSFIYTSAIDCSDMEEPGVNSRWTDIAGPTVGCSTCINYLPSDGNAYSYNVQSDPIVLEILQAQGWDFAGVASVALDIPFLSVISPVISVLTIAVQMPDNTGGPGLSQFTASWQSRSITAKSWFSPYVYPAAMALSVIMGFCFCLHAFDVIGDPRSWLIRRKLSM
jgi:hypothetical protein